VVHSGTAAIHHQCLGHQAVNAIVSCLFGTLNAVQGFRSKLSCCQPIQCLDGCTVAVVVCRPLDSELRSTAVSSSHAEHIPGQWSAQQHAAVLRA
jgi:hypothetical protein